MIVRVPTWPRHFFLITTAFSSPLQRGLLHNGTIEKEQYVGSGTTKSFAVNMKNVAVRVDRKNFEMGKGKGGGIKYQFSFVVTLTPTQNHTKLQRMHTSPNFKPVRSSTQPLFSVPRRRGSSLT
ncbi:hypothetical protein TNCV_1152941 [Trichonephila clavipes]|nr:hypothetical protein TNCV_1152941 [Trichonephila clavipes]